MNKFLSFSRIKQSKFVLEEHFDREIFDCCLIEFQYFQTFSSDHTYLLLSQPDKIMSYDSVERPHQLLVVVIDINPNQLLFARQPGSLSQLMNSVMTLLNQHMMLHTTNKARYC